MLENMPITQIMLVWVYVAIVGWIGLAIWEEFAQTYMAEIALFNRFNMIQYLIHTTS